MRTALLAHPEALIRLAEELVLIVRALSEAAGDLAMLTLPARLAKLLLSLPEVDGAVNLGSGQGELATRLGVVRQSCSRALADLQSRGLITVARGDRRVERLDRHGLRRSLAAAGEGAPLRARHGRRRGAASRSEAGSHVGMELI